MNAATFEDPSKTSSTDIKEEANVLPFNRELSRMLWADYEEDEDFEPEVTCSISDTRCDPIHL